MWLWLTLLAFASGVLVGRLSVRRYRHDRIAWAQRRLQLKVLSLELKSLRSKVVSAQGRRTPPAKRVVYHPFCKFRLAPLAGSARRSV